MQFLDDCLLPENQDKLVITGRALCAQNGLPRDFRKTFR